MQTILRNAPIFLGIGISYSGSTCMGHDRTPQQCLVTLRCAKAVSSPKQSGTKAYQNGHACSLPNKGFVHCTADGKIPRVRDAIWSRVVNVPRVNPPNQSSFHASLPTSSGPRSKTSISLSMPLDKAAILEGEASLLEKQS